VRQYQQSKHSSKKKWIQKKYHDIWRA
jgi:hypothetical protein